MLINDKENFTMKKNLVSMALLVAMLASLVVGCDTSTTSSTATSTPSSTGSSASTSTAPAEDDNGGKIGNGEEGFTYWVAMHASASKFVTDHNENPAAERIEEATGVVVDYISPPVGQEKEQFNLLIAGGDDLPDLIGYDFVGGYRGGVGGAIEDEVIIDATALIEEHAPHFMEMLNLGDAYTRGAYTDDGVIAYFGSAIADEWMAGRAFNGPIVNKTMLDKTGLDIPVTIADWEEMLQAFEDMGVEYPLSMGVNNNFIFTQGHFGAFGNAYDVALGATFLNKDGTVVFSPTEPGYKDTLTLLNKWYEEGWLYPDFLSAKTADARSDFEGGKVGVVVTHLGSVETAEDVSAALGIETVNPLPISFPVVNEGDELHIRQGSNIFNQAPEYITTSAEDPELIVKWMDWLYSPDGIQEITFGVKDDPRYEDTYYLDENGNKQYADILLTPDGNRHLLLRDIQTVWEEYSQKLQYTDPRNEVAWEEWGKADQDYMMPQTLSMTLDENDDFSKIMQDVNTYVPEMTAKFIMGTEPLENYDTFIETLEKMKIDEAIAIQQAALDRYYAR